MEKVFSDEEISGNHHWSVNGMTSLNRSASEWAFNRFIQESSAAADDGESTTACGVSVSSPPNVPVDSEEYRAFLKSKLNLACAAVAMKRVLTTLLKFEFFFFFIEKEKQNLFIC
jgi:hypothetical protein